MTLSFYYAGSNAVILKWAEIRHTYQVSWSHLVACLWSHGSSVCHPGLLAASGGGRAMPTIRHIPSKRRHGGRWFERGPIRMTVWGPHGLRASVSIEVTVQNRTAVSDSKTKTFKVVSPKFLWKFHILFLFFLPCNQKEGNQDWTCL